MLVKTVLSIVLSLLLTLGAAQQHRQAGGCPRVNCPQQQEPQFTCPCKRARNSSQCFSYDTSIQATTLDEAMFSFPDISDPSIHRTTMVQAPVHQQAQAASPSIMSTMAQDGASARIFAAPAASTPADQSCTSQACVGCKYYVMEGFARSYNTTTRPGKRQSGNHFNCPYIQQKQEKTKTSQVQAQSNNDHVVNQLVNVLQQAGQKRKKRDTNNNSVGDDQQDLKDMLLGVSTTISCDYQRGQQLDSDAPWCGLCNICWTWRRLPPNYFPGYLNEISCGSENSCLAGFGKCRPVLRTLTVLINTAPVGNVETWDQKTINSVAGCDCQVEIGTPLHSFITK